MIKNFWKTFHKRHTGSVRTHVVFGAYLYRKKIVIT